MNELAVYLSNSSAHQEDRSRHGHNVEQHTGCHPADVADGDYDRQLLEQGYGKSTVELGSRITVELECDTLKLR